MICPLSMPAGMETFTVFRLRICPVPLQLLQGEEMVLPLPPHRGQGPMVSRSEGNRTFQPETG